MTTPKWSPDVKDFDFFKYYKGTVEQQERHRASGVDDAHNRCCIRQQLGDQVQATA